MALLCSNSFFGLGKCQIILIFLDKMGIFRSQCDNYFFKHHIVGATDRQTIVTVKFKSIHHSELTEVSKDLILMFLIQLKL